MSIDLADALQIVLDLAKKAIISVFDDPIEHAKQIEAIKTIEDATVNEFGDD